MNMAETDRIEKKRLMRAPRSRVWRALTTPKEFGAWFGVALDQEQPFAAGTQVSAPITVPNYQHVIWNIVVEEVAPERRFSFRWHPHAIKTDVDYSAEPMTLVTFELEEVDEGTLLTVVESGFDAIPVARRAEAFRGNSDGWAGQMENIARHVDGTP